MWWKTNPKKLCNNNIKLNYNDTIPSGFYIIDKQFCKHYIKAGIFIPEIPTYKNRLPIMII